MDNKTTTMLQSMGQKVIPTICELYKNKLFIKALDTNSRLVITTVMVCSFYVDFSFRQVSRAKQPRRKMWFNWTVNIVGTCLFT